MPSSSVPRNCSPDARQTPTRRQRLSPDDRLPRALVVNPDGRELWRPPLRDSSRTVTPAEIWIRLTESDPRVQPATCVWDPEHSNLAEWLTQASQRWVAEAIELNVLAFGASLTRPESFDHFTPLAKKGPRWTVRLVTDGRSLASTAVLDRILRSSFDEMWVYPTGVGESQVSPRVLGAVKDLVDLRKARRQNYPLIIFRICPALGVKDKIAAELSLWAKQAGVDRTEITDKETEEPKLWA